MQGLTEKQDYLSKHILDQGYDPEEFQDFMLHYSNKQLDLNLWSLNQLKNIVAKFQKFKSKNGKMNEEELKQFDKQNENRNIDQMSNQDEKKSMSQIQEQIQAKKLSKGEQGNQKCKIKDHSSNSVNSSLYHYFDFKKKTVLPELYILLHVQHKPFTIKINNYSKTVPNNIFKSSYIQYQIETSEGWKTKRRFTDFIWLQDFLKTKHQGLPIPPIPHKTTIRSFDERHVDYRMMMLERFLTTLVQMPEVCSQPVLQIFLRGSHQYFSQSKKQLQQKLDSDLGATNLESIHGNELLLMDQHSIDQPIINFYKQYSTKLTNLSNQLNIAIENMRKVQSDMFDISSSFQEIQSLLQGSVKGFSFLGVLQQFCNGLGMHILKSTDYIKTQLYAPWNYQSMYTQNLLAHLQKCQKQHNSMTEKYRNAMLKIPEQGSQAFTNSMQPNKQIKQFQMVKELYRIRLSHTIRQTRRYQEEQMILLAKEWNNGIKLYVRDVSQWMIGCTDNLTKSMSVAEGKKLMEVQYIDSKGKDKEKQGGNIKERKGDRDKH